MSLEPDKTGLAGGSGRMNIISVILNSIVVLDMLVMSVLIFYRDKKWSLANGKKALKYFTFLSNEFFALAALLMILLPNSYAVWIVKFVGTVAITITFLTVLVFLGPVLGYKRVLEGRDFVLHIVNPVLAIVSFCFFERRNMPFPYCLFGLLPVLLYGAWYFYKVMLAPEGKKMDDFYGFNKNNKWILSVILMSLGTFAVCAAYWGIMLINRG